MKILSDENIPRKLKNDFPGSDEAFTIRDLGWLGTTNGALLKRMKERQFDLFITVDANIPYQQYTSDLPCPIVILRVFNNRRSTLAALLPSLFEYLLEHPVQTVLQWWGPPPANEG